MDWIDQYRRETEPDDLRLTRLRDTIDRRRRRPAPSRARPMLMAAAALLAVGGGYLGLRGDTALSDQPLEADTAPRLLAISRDVGVRFDGKGQINGTERAPHIRWEAGTLTVEVTPNRGVDLDVTTREAVVRVIGTGFTVQRDALGTRVTVAHGTVEVTCAGREPAYLHANDAAMCLPTSSAGLLARGAALRERHAPLDDVLATVDLGLSLETEGSPVRSELLLLRMQALAEGDRAEEALADADRYLDGENPHRRAEVLRFAGDIALDAAGCARALPYLRPLLGPDAATADLLNLADCSTDTRERASLLAQAQRRAATAEELSAVAARVAAREVEAY